MRINIEIAPAEVELVVTAISEAKATRWNSLLEIAVHVYERWQAENDEPPTAPPTDPGPDIGS